MNVSVEFYGQSRIISGVASVNLEIPNVAPVSSSVLCKWLVKKLPSLTDKVISSDSDQCLPSYMSNLNGVSFV